MRFVDIPTSDTLAGEPLDQTLMATINEDLDDLNARITTGSGGSSTSVISDSGTVAEITDGGQDNSSKYWKRRFYLMENQLSSAQLEGFDPAGIESNERLSFLQGNSSGLSMTVNSQEYLGQNVGITKANGISFKIKKDENFFIIGSAYAPTLSDKVSVYIDGVVNTPTTFGLVDENGSPAVNFFSTNTAVNYYQVPQYYFGLDGNPHIITVINEDSATKVFDFDYIEIGYKSDYPTIDTNINIKAGKSNGRNGAVTFVETNLSFTESNGNGYTGAVVVDSTGALTAQSNLNIQPAMTQVRAEQTIAFSGTVTTLPVKSSFYFPSTGIFLFSTPYGYNGFASYISKTETSVQAHSLDGIIWDNKPTVDMTALSNFQAATTVTRTGDLNINLWGTAPIIIDSTNNKIDFSVTVNGTTTTQTATVASGGYSADLVPLGVAIRKALQAAKPSTEEYIVSYSSSSQLWELGIGDNFTTTIITFLFASGANASTSIHRTLGFADTDLTGLTSYIGITAKQHLCGKVFEPDKNFMSAQDPRIKKTFVDSNSASSEIADIEKRLGFEVVTMTTNDSQNVINIYPDDDCCGLSITHVLWQNGTMMQYSIDQGDAFYLTQTDATIQSGTPPRGQLITSFISFPRGSRKISIIGMTMNTGFTMSGGSEWVSFVGCRQHFTKPNWESLPLNKAIIKTFDIAPISLYETVYGNNAGALYSPSTNDNINTLTESPAWASFVDTFPFNGASRYMGTNNGYIDINFTLVGDGGYLSMMTRIQAAQSNRASIFISTTAINEATDRIQNVNLSWNSDFWDYKVIKISGLKAGTYTARIKNDTTIAGSNTLHNIAICIADTVPPQINANTVTAVANAGQGVTFPINTKKITMIMDSPKKTPSYLFRTGYKEGLTSFFNYKLSTNTWDNYDDSATIISENTHYYDARGDRSTVLNSAKYFSIMCKSLSISEIGISSYSTTVTPFLDGIQSLNTYSTRVCIKSGSAPSGRTCTPRLYSKLFNLSCTFSSGKTYNISDTRGIRVGQIVRLWDGTNWEKFTIASIVASTSFTIVQTPAVITASNVTKVDFSGFHSFKVVQSEASTWSTSSFEYEPLSLLPSLSLSRTRIGKAETATINFQGVTNGASLYYPTFTDGSAGTYQNSSISVISMSAASAYNIPQNLKNITVASGNLTVTISSSKNVFSSANDDKDVR